MKRQSFFSILFGTLLLAGAFLPSCTNEDVKENIPSGKTRTLTFSVSDEFNEESNEDSRALIEEQDTVYQGFSDGMKIEAILEKDKTMGSRSVSNLKPGTKILAIIINLETQRVYKMHELEVDNSYKIQCDVPDYKVRIVFYSYNNTTMPATSLQVGDPVSSTTRDKTEYFSNDVMWAQIEETNPSSEYMGVVKFKHLFSRIRVSISYPYLTVFKVYLSSSGVEPSSAKVRIIPGTISSVSGSNGEFSFFKDSETTTTLLESDYQMFIPSTTLNQYTLLLGTLNWYAIDKKATFSKKFESGSSYTLRINLEKDPIIWGWSEKYYQWDAKIENKVGVTPPASSDENYNTSDGAAAYSCKECPTYDDMQRMLASGVYWDTSGPEWTGADGNKYRSGLWVLKKKFWGTDKKTNATPQTATSAIRNSSDYMFLPAAGRLFSHHGYTISEIGTAGFYWASETEPYYVPSGYNLYFDESVARAESYERGFAFSRWAFWE